MKLDNTAKFAKRNLFKADIFKVLPQYTEN